MSNYKFVNCALEIPVGWDKMVNQMLGDIAPWVENYPEFEFIQIKEKYNRLVAYANMSIPEVEEVLNKYAAMAGFVCANCGAPATKEMQNYVLSYCDDCWKDLRRHDNWVPIKLETDFEIVSFSAARGKEYKNHSFKDEWDRLYSYGGK